MASDVVALAHSPVQELLVKQHALFALRCLKYLPTPYQGEDNNRMSLAFFCLSSLAILPASAIVSTSILPAEQQSALDFMLKPQQKKDYIEWVYRQQASGGGFRGSDSMQGSKLGVSNELASGNLIQTYTALLVLGLLRDDYSRLNKEKLLLFLSSCQAEDGSFLQFPLCSEPGDPRSVYSAFAISSILHNWTGINITKALEFLKRCQHQDGGFGNGPGLEPQGGTTYCSIASFQLSSRMSEIPRSGSLLRWLVYRQKSPSPSQVLSDDELDDEAINEGPQTPYEVAGFQGRPNKDPDACYSFWCGASIKLLRPSFIVTRTELDHRWLSACQHKVYGGLAREPGALPDVYHSYLALAALSLGQHPGLHRMDAAWNVAQHVATYIRTAVSSQ